MKAFSSIALYLCALTLAFGFGSCSSSSDDAPASTFSVVRSSYDPSPQASSATIVLSEPGFEVSTDAPWLTATVQNGTEVLVSLQENTSSESRTGSVLLSKAGVTRRVPFTQLGVVNMVSGVSAELSYNRRGGTSRYALSGPDQVQVSIPAAAQSWISYSIVDGELVLTCAPMVASAPDDRRATITIAKGVYFQRVTITQVWGNVIYEDLLGEYTLSYTTWKDRQVTTATVRLEPKTEGSSYWLTGLAANVEVGFDEKTTALTIKPQTVANNAAYVAGWVADASGWFDREGWTLTGAWNRNMANPAFAFTSTDVITNDGTNYPIIGFIFWKTDGGEYKGADGAGISRVVQFSITKN